MPTRRNSEIAGPRLGSGPALLAALVAAAICLALPPASAAAASPGELYAFGNNYYGQLGNATNNGTENPNPNPTLVTLPGAGGPVTQVAAGYQHSLALTSSGQLYAFGYNYYGELGREANESPNPTPALVTLPGAGGPVTQIAGGGEHSLALTSSGQLYSFGYNYLGELGIATNSGTNNPNPTPALVTLPGAGGPVTQIAGGEYHSLALTSTGQLYAFGQNQYGQLGVATNSGTNNPTPTPTLVTLPGASGAVTQVVGGGFHSLALTSSGQLYAFGNNYYGQLGNATNNGTNTPNPTPTLVTLPGASGAVTQIAAGAYHSLALTSSDQLYAFGRNYYGDLGNTANNGTTNPNPTPALVTLPGADGAVTQIAAGYEHSFALTSSGQLYAFGNNSYGQLGREANENPNPTPTLVDLGAGTTIDTMASGVEAEHTLVVVANLAVATGSLPSGRVGARYRASATAVGGTSPYSWQASGLPAGLSIDAGGQIRGKPKKAGTAQVQLSVSDSFGIGAQSPSLALRIAPRLAISKLRQSHRRWRVGRRRAKVSSAGARRKRRRAALGTTFTFRLNGRARVRFAFAKRRKGRKGRRFKKAGALTFAGHRGRNRVAFQGRISRRKRLKPGRYRLTATAKSGGARSKPRSLRFTIVR